MPTVRMSLFTIHYTHKKKKIKHLEKLKYLCSLHITSSYIDKKFQKTMWNNMKFKKANH